MKRVVITGLGVVTSLSCEVNDLWQRLLAGESGIHPLKNIDVSDFKITIGGDVQHWDPSEHLHPREQKRMDRFAQFGIVAGANAIQDSGLEIEKENPFRCGIILGSGIGGLNEIEDQMTRLLYKGPSKVSPMTVPRMMLNAAGGNMAIHLGLRGINFTVATACASATNAIGEAFRHIQNGNADMILTGGTEAAVTRMGLAGFQNMKALSPNNDNPTGASRPFDADRNGFVLSEGAGMLVLEELEHASARNAKIYGEVLGYGSTGDAGHITAPNESGDGAAQAMSNAMADAKLNANEISYINAHGTSTSLGDKAETLAVKRVFGDEAYNISISSTKSQLGHTLGSSGGIEAVISAKALETGVVPPTINLETPDPDCDLDYTPNTPKEKNIQSVMSNSFGFGGHNATIVFGALQ